MLIKKIKMTNWCSFLGEHIIDFNPKEDNSIYAFFGEIGKGKSSIVQGLEWCLFGTVWDTIIVEDQIKRQKRPLIDNKYYYGEKSSFALPLLTDLAFRNRDFKTEIELNFTHKDDEWVLVRSAQPRSTIVGMPQKNTDMEVHIRLENKEGEIWTSTESPDNSKNSRIQPKIEEIIPESVSRFFFIRGDSVQEFTGLIQGDEKNTSLREQVDTVVGIPAITRSQKEFRRMIIIEEDKISKMGRKNMAMEGDKNQYDQLQEKIERIENGFVQNGIPQLGLIELKEKSEEIDRRKIILHTKMKEDQELRDLLVKVEGEEENLNELKEDLPNLRKKLKKSGEGVWKIIIQRKIKNKIIQLETDAKRELEIEDEIQEISTNMPHLLERLESADGVIPCPTCDKNRDALTSKERQELETNKEEAFSRQNVLNEELEIISGSLTKQNILKDWRTDIIADDFANLYEDFWTKYNLIEVKKEEIKRMRDALSNQNVKHMEKTQKEYEEIISEKTDIDHDIHAAERLIQDYKNNQKRLSFNKDGLQENDKSNLGKLKKKEKILKWIEAVWEKSLEEYRENIRDSIDKVCTERWLNTVAEPEKYSEVKTNTNWGLEVYGKDGHWAAIGNPGHRSLLALCFIESLRFCSDIQFPLIFDNPGSAADQKTVGSILDYYMKNPPGQFIVLSHSSGMREEEMMNIYNENIDKAWRVDYIKGEDRNSELKLIGG